MRTLKRARVGQTLAISVLALVVAILVIVGWLASIALVQFQIQPLREAKHMVDASKEWVDVRIFPRNDSGQIVPLLRFYGRWSKPSFIDYVVIKCRVATGPCGSGGFIKAGFSLAIQPLEERFMRPSQIHPALARYDGDYWRMKNEIEYIEIHTGYGNTFLAAWGDPEYNPLSEVRITTSTLTTQTTTTRPPVIRTVTPTTTSSSSSDQPATLIYYCHLFHACNIHVFVLIRQPSDVNYLRRGGWLISTGTWATRTVGFVTMHGYVEITMTLPVLTPPDYYTPPGHQW